MPVPNDYKITPIKSWAPKLEEYQQTTQLKKGSKKTFHAFGINIGDRMYATVKHTKFQARDIYDAVHYMVSYSGDTIGDTDILLLDALYIPSLQKRAREQIMAQALNQIGYSENLRWPKDGPVAIWQDGGFLGVVGADYAKVMAKYGREFSEED